MEFGEVTHVKGVAFYASQMSGILGLGYGNISVDKLPTFLASSNLTDKSFSFYLGSLPDPSYMHIPGKEADSVVIATHDVVEEGYWSLNLTQMKQGDTVIPVSGYKGVIDSGTSLLAGPEAITNPLIEGITVA